MSRLPFVSLILLALPIWGAAEEPTKPDYFPLAPGNTWAYKTTFETKGEKTPDALTKVTTTKQVVKVEMQDGKTTATLESALDFGMPVGNGPEKTREVILADGTGVYNPRPKGSQSDQATPLFKYPLKPGVIFTGTVREGDVEVTTQVTVREMVEVVVPAGTYKAVPVETTVTSKAATLTSMAWYASGVGLVKQTYLTEKLTITLELKAFTPGK